MATTTNKKQKQPEVYVYEWGYGNGGYIYYQWGKPYIYEGNKVGMHTTKDGKIKSPFMSYVQDMEDKVLMALKAKKPKAEFYEIGEYERMVQDLIAKENNGEVVSQ